MKNNNYSHIDSLVDRVKELDNEALWELFDFYQPLVKACCTKVHSKYKFIEKDDLFSECVLIFKDLCEKYDKDKSYFSYFLETRLQPYLISKIKSKYVDKHNMEDLSECEYYEIDICDAYDHKAAVEEAISRIPETYQKAIDLFYFKNLTQSECAIVLGITQPAFNKKIKKALDLLKEEMKEFS